MVNPTNGYTEPMIQDVQEAARAKGVDIILRASTESEIDAAFTTINDMHADALVIGDDPFFVSRQGQLVGLASRYGVPTSYQFREFAVAGSSRELQRPLSPLLFAKLASTLESYSTAPSPSTCR